MWRDLALKASLVLLLALAALFAWLTRHPESRLLERAVEWPLVAPLAESFRALYLPPPSAGEEGEEEVGREVIYLIGRLDPEREPEPRLGARPRVWVRPDTALRAAPDNEAPVRATVPSYANLEILERREDWLEVRYGEERGWIRREPAPEDGEPPLGSDPAPPLPLEARPPDPETLAAARGMLSGQERRGRLGPYDLYTDCDDDALLAWLERILAGVEGAYRLRYAVTPVGEPRGAVVLFEHQRDYFSFKSSGSLGDLVVAGHTGRGVISTSHEGYEDAELAATLVHEVVHLLNKRALGPALPPWIEEGIAADLGGLKADESGGLLPGTFGGVTMREGGEMQWRGPLASAIWVRRAVEEGRLVPLVELADLDSSDFQRPGQARIHYAQSSSWIRYLLDGPDPELTRGYRIFLASVARGGPVEAEALRGYLGRSWAELEEGYRRWVILRYPEPQKVALGESG